MKVNLSFNHLLPDDFKIISYQTWVKKEFFKKPKGLTYKQLLKAKDCYECDRICFFYTGSNKSRKEAVLEWIFKENNYDAIFKYHNYKKIIFYNPYNNAVTYVYFGK